MAEPNELAPVIALAIPPPLTALVRSALSEVKSALLETAPVLAVSTYRSSMRWHVQNMEVRTNGGDYTLKCI